MEARRRPAAWQAFPSECVPFTYRLSPNIQNEFGDKRPFNTFNTTAKKVRCQAGSVAAWPARRFPRLISPSYLTVLSHVSCVKPRGWNPGGHRAGFWLVPWRRRGFARRLDLFRIICTLPNVCPELFIYEWRHPACKNEFTSVCRLQTRLTTYKGKNIFFILLTTCFFMPTKAS